MRTKCRVIHESKPSACLKVIGGKGRPEPDPQKLFERAPEALDDGDGTILTNGAESLFDRKCVKGLAEHR